MNDPEDLESETHTQKQENPQNIEKHRKILTIIGEYKMKIVEKNTHSSQDPSVLLELVPILQNASDTIVDFVIRGDEPMNQDQDLRICINALQSINKEQPWDSDDRILIKPWCRTIFGDYIFSDTERILEIYKDNY
jgi:hypothetical protein